MQEPRWQLFALITLLTISTLALAQSPEDTRTATVDARDAVVIAFLPPAARDPNDRAATQARAHVAEAIEITKRCLGDVPVSYRSEFVDRIVIRSPEREEIFQVSQLAPLAGALLFRPGSNPRILFAGGGPDALVEMLPRAAAEYYGVTCAG